MGGSSNSSKTVVPTLADLLKKYSSSGQPSQINWQFPQYSQTWAFTPPTPKPYVLPPANSEAKKK